MDYPEIFREPGCSARTYRWFNACMKPAEHPSVREYERRVNETDTEVVIETPVGSQREVRRATPNSRGHIRVKWPVATREELKAATWRAENRTWEWDDDLFLIDGIPAVYFDATFPVSVLEECVRKIIALFAPKLIPGISDEISSTGDIERVRVVGKIVAEHNASCPTSPKN